MSIHAAPRQGLVRPHQGHKVSYAQVGVFDLSLL